MISAQDYRQLAADQAVAEPVEAAFEAVRRLVEKRIGFGLLTMLMLAPDGDEVQRIYTTDPVHYPVSGREQLGTTAWGQHVLVDRQPFLGADRAAVRWAFPADYDLIVSLGLGATMNIPVIALGRTLGSMNILDAEGRYTSKHLAAAASLAPYLIAAFLHHHAMEAR